MESKYYNYLHELIYLDFIKLQEQENAKEFRALTKFDIFSGWS